jgi:hypothetical protein
LGLAVLALIGLFAPALGGIRVQTLVNALVASGSVFVLGHFARTRRSVARAELARRPGGRILERRDEHAHRIFELPGAGVEPWSVDAWIVAVLGAAALFMGLSGEGLARPVAFVLVLLAGALSLRLLSVSLDHIRLELGENEWRVQAHEGGRLIRRSGEGTLSAELLPEALVLWSADGRVGVLRGELEPEERSWLAGRLATFSGRTQHHEPESVPEQARGEVEQAEPSEHRKRE